MGQQQLLLLVLAAVIVGMAIVVGINMFSQNSAQANQDAITQDLMTIAAQAQGWYRRPTTIGGGGRTFVALTNDAAGWQKINYTAASSGNYENDNASYALSGQSATSLTITGTSVQDSDGDGTKMVLTATVTPGTVSVAVTTPD